MNKRLISIINELVELNKSISISDLAKKYQVSERTIRNDLNLIQEILAKNNLSALAFGANGYVNREKDFPCIKEHLSSTDFYQYKLSKEERKILAASILISSTEYITLSTIADQLFVSRATVINDLDGVKKYLSKGNLTVLSHPNKGLRVEGQESDKREFLIQILDLNMDQFYKSDRDLLPGIQAGDNVTIQKILIEQEQLHQYHLTDESFHNIRRYLRVMIQRNFQGEFIEPQKHELNNKYRMAQDILRYITQYCNNASSEDEVIYFSKILDRCQYLKQISTNQDAIKTQLLTRQYIEAVSEELEINLNSDYDFYENLYNHLESIFTKKNVIFPQNTVFEEVIQNNPDVLRAAKKHLNIFEKYINRKIEEIEMEYIAIHICAALERRKNKEIAFHVVLACNGGIGTSQLLLARLKKHFNFHIVDIISAHEVKNIDREQVDLVISTIPLKDCQVEHIKVSPLLSDEDYIRVGSKIDALRNNRRLPLRIQEKELSARGLLRKIKPIVTRLGGTQTEELMDQIKSVVQAYFNESSVKTNDIFSPYLHQLLSSEYIELDVECSDWREAVQKSAQILLKRGYIEERYITAMISNIEKNGPYVVLTKGFAMPHEGLDCGALKVGMGMIRLRQPVCFGDAEFDPVEFVCCLSAVDHKSHLKAFFHLVNMLKDEMFLVELRAAKTKSDCVAVIEKFEYGLDNL